MMEGNLWVESEVGVGSTFYFTIAATALIESVQITPEDMAAKLKNKRVLLIDDHATNRQVLTQQTLAFGMQPQAVASAEAALTLLKAAKNYDVVILSMQLPKMDGLSLAAAIHRLPGYQQLPLILLTALGQSPQIVDPQGDLSAFLHKPVKQFQLYTTLVKVLTQQDFSRPSPLPEVPKFDTGMAEKYPLKILLAEDNVVNQKVALNILKRLGYRADVVANGLEVLQALNRQSYDVILMDVQMPELDGLITTHQICQRYAPFERPWIIAMTANAMQGDREACLEVGMNDYVSKPIRVEALVESLQKVPPLPSSDQLSRGEVGQKDVVLDPTALDEIRSFAGKDADLMLAELFECYLQDAPEMIQQIGQALDQQNYSDLATAAHTLKSSSASLGAARVSQLCSQLETLGRNYSSNPNLEPPQPTVTDLVSTLLDAYEQAQAILNQELDTISQRLDL
jgi:CheY-like chemotaxis protein